MPFALLPALSKVQECDASGDAMKYFFAWSIIAFRNLLLKLIVRDFSSALSLQQNKRMAVNKDLYAALAKDLNAKNVTLIAVSKTKPVEDILALYELGQRDFGENYVQELQEKQKLLPADINWHFIGHLQSNKVKYISGFTHLIHGVDSYKLLAEINKQALKEHRIIDCLLQVHIAQEDTKFGFNEAELQQAIEQSAQLNNIRITGLMGMASFTEDLQKVKMEFIYLRSLFDKYKETHSANYNLQTLSMGMSSDYKIAIEQGSNMVRIGSLLFGERVYK